MKKKLLLVGLDAAFLSSAFAFAALWSGVSPRQEWIFLGVFLAIKIFFIMRFGLYHAILKYAGLPLAIEIIKASFYASLLCFFLAHVLKPSAIPLGFFVTDYLLSTSLMGLVRFAPRYFRENWGDVGTKRVVIYGAGELGETIARKLIRMPGEYCLLGFLDDSPAKRGHRLHNLPILGPMSDLPSLVAKHRISEIIIAIADLTGEAVREVTHECRRNGVLCRIVPSFSNMLKQDVSIKNIDISDLLKRDPKDLDQERIEQFIRDRVILITGAGGSIGAELARQCIRFGARKLVLVDHSEINIYQIQEELADAKIPVRFCLLNVLNEDMLAKVMADERPTLFFHAAAYKHVPIVEQNPGEGMINNIQGTMVTARLAEKYGVEKYVMISTDKAVRPTNLMGASKRICELYVQNLDQRSKTEFVAVRFGNVLGSSGSVIPKFIEQINRGGPVTVTHPDVTRYFMLISEAVQLVLQAASLGQGGEIFILNMGKPVRIAEMAEDLIFLAGREPHKDIQIEFTGLRAGEKLYEELLVDETEKKTQYENITIGRATTANWADLLRDIQALLEKARGGEKTEIAALTKRLVPEYQPPVQEPRMATAPVLLRRLPNTP
ncbi:MAG TPA: nucleoside-diphosphate sugar epimerase/dehydratase [bacterium]|nr:nucleoside-diphosphate sugar epimerase/dehydratase [bacterium]